MSILTRMSLPTGASIPGLGQFPISLGPRGAVLYVNSAIGNDNRGRVNFVSGSVGGYGLPSKPLASVFGANGALSFCVAGRGDLIIVEASHAENLTTSGFYTIPANTAILGIGAGPTRPTFTFTGGTATSIQPGAGVQMNNLVFDGTGFAAVVKIFDLRAAGAQFVNVRVIQASVTNQAANGIVFNAGADDIIFANFDLDSSAATGATQGFFTQGAALISRLMMINSNLHGDWSAAPVKVAAAGNAFSELLVRWSTVRQTGTVVPCFVWSTADTGVFEHCNFATKATAGPPTAATISGSPPVGLTFVQCFATSGNTAAARSGLLAPAATTL